MVYDRSRIQCGSRETGTRDNAFHSSIVSHRKHDIVSVVINNSLFTAQQCNN